MTNPYPCVFDADAPGFCLSHSGKAVVCDEAPAQGFGSDALREAARVDLDWTYRTFHMDSSPDGTCPVCAGTHDREEADFMNGRAVRRLIDKLRRDELAAALTGDAAPAPVVTNVGPDQQQDAKRLARDHAERVAIEEAKRRTNDIHS